VSALFERLSCLIFQRVFADNPRTVCEWVIGLDFTAIDSQAESARADIEISSGIRQVDPRRRVIRLVTGNAMMTAQSSDSLACPSIASSCEMAISIQDAGDDVVG
jgi:hypothetical protein